MLNVCVALGDMRLGYLYIRVRWGEREQKTRGLLDCLGVYPDCQLVSDMIYDWPLFNFLIVIPQYKNKMTSMEYLYCF